MGGGGRGGEVGRVEEERGKGGRGGGEEAVEEEEIFHLNESRIIGSHLYNCVVDYL